MSNHDNNIHNDDLDIPMPDDATCGIGDENEGNLDIGSEDLEDEMRNSVDDMNADAEALASAGHGTDEDYGYFGGGEE